MSPSFILIEKAQARLYAQAGNWEEFSKSAANANQKSIELGWLNVADWMAELWFEFALSENYKRLAEYSQWFVGNKVQSHYSLPTLSTLMDSISSEPRLQWILKHDDLHDIWIAATEIPVPNKEWRARHHVFGAFLPAYIAWMREQPEIIQARQKNYLEKYGNEAMQAKSLLYYAICAYATPTREQVRAVAVANNPIYDMVRLEEQYPGIRGLRAAYEGMGLKSHALRDRLCQFMDGTAPSIEEAIPLNGFESH